MKQTVQTFVQQCEVCQQAKIERIRQPGLLQPLSVPSQAWEVVSLDFIEGLPPSDRYNAILVVVDKFTKYGHFIPIHHPYTAMQIAKVYLDNIYKLHGLPKAMISDRDPVFTSNVWQQLFKLTDTKLLMSSAYHSQTDERLKQCLEGFLRCTVHSCPRQWSKWLSVAEYWYNTTYHSAIGHSPSEVLYGHNPRHFGISNLQMCSVLELEQWLKERELLSTVIQLLLTRAQQRMKSQADKKRSERSFQPGDMVYMKLQPYVQSTAAARPNKKLSFRYYGPYRVLERIREVAYRLDLPAHSRINPVLHVSQLKKQVAAGCEISDDLSTVCTDPATVLQLEKTLDRRMIQRGAEAVKQVKIKWTNLPEAMATWEDATAYEECDDFLA